MSKNANIQDAFNMHVPFHVDYTVVKVTFKDFEIKNNR